MLLFFVIVDATMNNEAEAHRRFVPITMSMVGWKRKKKEDYDYDYDNDDDENVKDNGINSGNIKY